MALTPRKLKRGLLADALYNQCMGDEVPDIQHAILKKISEAYSFNREELAKKGENIRSALLALGVEVVFIGIGIAINLWG